MNIRNFSTVGATHRGRMFHMVVAWMLSITLVIGLMPSTQAVAEVLNDGAADDPQTEQTQGQDVQGQGEGQAAAPEETPSAEEPSQEGESTKAPSEESIQPQAEEATQPAAQSDDEVSPQAASSVSITQLPTGFGDATSWRSIYPSSGSPTPKQVKIQVNVSDADAHTIELTVPENEFVVVGTAGEIANPRVSDPTVSGNKITLQVAAGAGEVNLSLDIDFKGSKTGDDIYRHTGTLPSGKFEVKLLSSANAVESSDSKEISFTTDTDAFSLWGAYNIKAAQQYTTIHQHEGIPKMYATVQLGTACITDYFDMKTVSFVAPTGFKFAACPYDASSQKHYTLSTDGTTLTYDNLGILKSTAAPTDSSTWNKGGNLVFTDEPEIVLKDEDKGGYLSYNGSWKWTTILSGEKQNGTYVGVNGDDFTSNKITYYTCKEETKAIEGSITNETPATAEDVVPFATAESHTDIKYFNDVLTSGYTHYYNNAGGEGVTGTYTYPYAVQPSEFKAGNQPTKVTLTYDDGTQATLDVAAGGTAALPAVKDGKWIKTLTYVVDLAAPKAPDYGYSAGVPTIKVQARDKDENGASTTGKTYGVGVSMKQPSYTKDGVTTQGFTREGTTYYKIVTDCRWLPAVNHSMGQSYVGQPLWLNLNCSEIKPISGADVYRPEWTITGDYSSIENVPKEEAVSLLDGTFVLPDGVSGISFKGWTVEYSTNKKGSVSAPVYATSSGASSGTMNFTIPLDEGEYFTGDGITFKAPGWVPCVTGSAQIVAGVSERNIVPATGEAFEPVSSWYDGDQSFENQCIAYVRYALKAKHEENPDESANEYCETHGHFDWTTVATSQKEIVAGYSYNHPFTGVTTIAGGVHQGDVSGAFNFEFNCGNRTSGVIGLRDTKIGIECIYIQLLDDSFSLAADQDKAWVGGEATNYVKYVDAEGKTWLKVQAPANGLLKSDSDGKVKIEISAPGFLVPAAHEVGGPTALFGNIVVVGTDEQTKHWSGESGYPVTKGTGVDIDVDRNGFPEANGTKNMLYLGTPVRHDVTVTTNESINTALVPGIGTTFNPEGVTYHDWQNENLTAKLEMRGAKEGAGLRDGSATVSILGKGEPSSADAAKVVTTTGAMHLTGPATVADSTVADSITITYNVGGTWVTNPTDWSAVTKIKVDAEKIKETSAVTLVMPLKADCLVDDELGALQATYTLSDVVGTTTTPPATYQRSPKTDRNISGYIFKDNNGDNSYTAGVDTPLAGSTVYLLENGVRTGDSAVSGADGKYTITTQKEVGLSLETEYDATKMDLVAVNSGSSLGNRFVVATGKTGVASMSLGDYLLFDCNYANVGFRYATPGSLDVTATKTLDGQPASSDDNVFDFELSGGGLATPIAANNDQNGAIAFTVPLTKAGTYEYAVTEKAGTAADILYDATAYTLKVTVSEASGALTASKVEVFKGDEQISPDAITFENKAAVTINYAAEANGSVSPASEKIAVTDGVAAGSTATPDTGYRLVNWTDSANKVVSTSATFVPEKVNGANVAETYTAHFAKRSFPVKFDLDGGTPDPIVSVAGLPANQIMVEYGQVIATATDFPATAPTKTGYQFTGWKVVSLVPMADAAAGAMLGATDTMPADEVDLIATWKKNDDPTKPTEPTGPTDDPTEPKDPTNPTNPTDPSNPVIPAAGTTTGATAVKATTITPAAQSTAIRTAKTADSVPAAAGFIGLSLMSAAFVALYARRRKENDAK